MEQSAGRRNRYRGFAQRELDSDKMTHCRRRIAA
jgi:hypothetical protein